MAVDGPPHPVWLGATSVSFDRISCGVDADNATATLPCLSAELTTLVTLSHAGGNHQVAQLTFEPDALCTHACVRHACVRFLDPSPFSEPPAASRFSPLECHTSLAGPGQASRASSSSPPPTTTPPNGGMPALQSRSRPSWRMRLGLSVRPRQTSRIWHMRPSARPRPGPQVLQLNLVVTGLWSLAAKAFHVTSKHFVLFSFIHTGC